MSLSANADLGCGDGARSCDAEVELSSVPRLLLPHPHGVEDGSIDELARYKIKA